MHVVDLLTQGERVDSTVTERVQACKGLMALGLDRAEVADALDASKASVDRYFKAIMRQDGITSLWDAVVLIQQLKSRF